MDERRGHVRTRTLRGARIAFGNMSMTMDCIIRDLSPGGARLRLPSTAGVPSSFVLLDERGGRRRCRLVWGSPTEIGVEFVADGAHV